MLHLLLLVSLVFLQSAVYSQIDPEKLDSLQRKLQTNTKTYQKWQDSFRKSQHNIQQEHVTNDSFKPLNHIAEKEKAEKKRNQRFHGYIFVAIVLLIAVTAGILFSGRGSKRQKST